MNTTNLTEEQKREVMVVFYSSYNEIFDIIMQNKWTKEMFVYYCRELYRDGQQSAYNEACL